MLQVATALKTRLVRIMTRIPDTGYLHQTIVVFLGISNTIPVHLKIGHDLLFSNYNIVTMQDLDMRFEVLKAVFWLVTTCGLVVGYQRFGRPYCLHLQGEQ
jgi:hypothetical protein